MKPFAYERPGRLPEARALGQAGAYLAGGTNLIDHLKLGIREEERLVDLGRLVEDRPELGRVSELPGGGLRIGALVKNSELAAHPLIRGRYPAVAEALLAGASGQIRNMASTAGNLLQRTRCVYFQDPTTPCNKREPGSGCSALEGFGRYNALLGTSGECVAVHPSDLCVPLAALEAEVVFEGGPQGEGRLPFRDFHRLPGDTPHLDTNLPPGALITALELAPLPLAAHSTYRKVRDRSSYAFALVSVAAALEVEEGRVKDVRLAFGGVAHKPWRAGRAEAALRGQPATREHFRAAVEAELEAARPGRDNAYKLPMLRNTVVATLEELLEGRTPERRAAGGAV